MADSHDQPKVAADGPVNGSDTGKAQSHDPYGEYRSPGYSGKPGDVTVVASNDGDKGLSGSDATIKHIPEVVRSAATAGDDSAPIMRVASADHYDRQNKPPTLSPEQQKVFDALKAQGLNPSLDAEYYHQGRHDPSEYAWVMRANWKDGEKPNPELQILAHQGQADRRAAEDQRRVDGLRSELAGADLAIKNIPDIVRQEATAGNDSAPIMSIASANSLDRDPKPPELDAAQQKVFDALKAQGLNPTLNAEYYHQGRHDPSAYAWVMRANWKDGENPDPALQTLTHQGKARIEADEAQRHLESLRRAMADADSAIQNIPATVSKARASGSDDAQILRVGSSSRWERDPQPPKLDAAQQKVFDALKAKGLNPSVNRELVYESHEPSNYAWVIRANWNHGDK